MPRARVARPMPDGPAQWLERHLDQRVTLVLKDARELSGTLLGADEHMNVVLDDASERAAERSRHLGRVVLRGSNVVVAYLPPASASSSR
jgi:small nuclear ribonucleoprotein (snRNP)-like protein